MLTSPTVLKTHHSPSKEEIPLTAFSSIKKEDENPSVKNQKLIQYLETLENHCALDKSMNLYQERFHCIHKAINSIKQHSDCYVSDFLSHYKPSSSPLNEEKKENIQTTSLTTTANNKIKEKEVDQILRFIESELYINKENKSNINSNNTSSSANSDTPIKDNKINNKRLSKVFLKIELKLKTHLEEQKMIDNNSLRGSNFSMHSKNSFYGINEMNRSIRKHRHSFLPQVMRNFFVDKENMEKNSQHRKSVFTKGRIRSSLKTSELVNGSFKKKLSVSECNHKNKLGFDSEQKEVSRFDNGDFKITDFLFDYNKNDESMSEKSENSENSSEDENKSENENESKNDESCESNEKDTCNKNSNIEFIPEETNEEN